MMVLQIQHYSQIYTLIAVIFVLLMHRLIPPTNNFAGVVWIGTERIEYTERNTLTNKLSGITQRN